MHKGKGSTGYVLQPQSEGTGEVYFIVEIKMLPVQKKLFTLSGKNIIVPAIQERTVILLTKTVCLTKPKII
jgi:hypothetical protein